MPKLWRCPNCEAGCTFEAMQWCTENDTGECPTLEALERGTITDRRASDLNPSFPSEFTFIEEDKNNAND